MKQYTTLRWSVITTSIFYLLLLILLYLTRYSTTAYIVTEDDQDWVYVVVGFNDTKSSTITTASSLRGSTTGTTSTSTTITNNPENELITKFGGYVTTPQLKRTNAIGIKIPLKQIDSLKADPTVSYVEDDNLVYPLAEETGYALSMIDAANTYIPKASSYNQISNDKCFKVCIVDGGVLLSHEDIPWNSGSGNVMGKEFNLPKGQTYDRPLYNHGTHVGGILGATWNNNLGVKGVIGDTSNICIMVARVFDDDGNGQQDSVILQAAEWCADNGARIINMSLGSPGSGTSYAKSVYDSIYADGALVFSASGNTNDNTRNYPASFDSVVSVAAVDKNKKRAYFSNYNDDVDIAAPGVNIRSTVPATTVKDDNGKAYGVIPMEYSVKPNTPITGLIKNCNQGQSDYDFVGVSGKICVMKRGGNSFADKVKTCQSKGGIGAIVYNNVGGDFTGTLGGKNVASIPAVGTSLSDGTLLIKKSKVTIAFTGSGYEEISGTSMATPYVAGVATKIWAARPQCTNKQVRDAIMKSALSLGTGSALDKEYYGNGLVQAEAAYDELLKMPAPCGSPALPASSTTTTTKWAPTKWFGGSSTPTTKTTTTTKKPSFSSWSTWNGGWRRLFGYDDELDEEVVDYEPIDEHDGFKPEDHQSISEPINKRVHSEPVEI